MGTREKRNLTPFQNNSSQHRDSTALRTYAPARNRKSGASQRITPHLPAHQITQVI
ncbi:hypothetical protein ACFXPS_43655 [Nocardia sp. NPDC059091]|uniref:hypothetical protein n=1 Tax=Nocardia sp. NPDC059091 TaxID=3346724 RepID=UPI0036C40AEA